MSLLNPQRPILQLIVVGICAFLFFLFIKTPASLLTHKLSKQLPVTFIDVKGTIWHGEAKQFYYQGATLGNLSWSIPVYRILTGKISTDFMLEGPEVKLAGRVGYGLGSELLLENTQIDIQASKLSQLLQIPFPAQGKVKVDIQYLILNISAAEDEAKQTLRIPKVNATLNWENAGIPAFNINNLGSYSFTLKSEPAAPNVIIAQITESKGSLEITGNASINLDRRYKAEFSLKPSNDAPEILTNGLSMLGRPDENGRYLVNREGEIREILAFF